MTEMPDISIVVPVFGSDSTLVPLHERIAAAADRIPASFELIFVDDCGPGNPWEIITRMGQSDPRVIGLKLSKNCGQHIAITAGMDLARGRRIVVMDCDLQDRPEEIPRLWAKAREGHDIVVGRRIKRQDGLVKRLLSRAFHFTLRHMTDQQSDAAQSNFGIYSRNVVDKVKTLSEYPRVFPLFVRQLGFEIAAIDVEHDRRTEGKSSYTFFRKLSLAIDILSFYSQKTLNIGILSGFLTVLAVFCYSVWLVTHHFPAIYVSNGWTVWTASLLLLPGGLFLLLTVMGVYIYRVYNRGNGKPLYLVQNRINAVRDN